jgi:UDP-N-acetyl-D-glucosamine dehydrogenase
LFGIAYKRDVNDVRESPALDIIELLTQRGATVSYTDPFIPCVNHGEHHLAHVPFDQAIAGGHDCAVVATDHSQFDYTAIARLPLVVDTRNALKSTSERRSVFRL